MLQRVQSTGLIPYLLSDTWETVSGGKMEFHKSLKERGLSVTVQTLWPPSEAVRFSGLCSLCQTCQWHVLSRHYAAASLTHRIFLEQPFWESFWHKADFCRSVTYSQGEGWIPFLPMSPLTYGAQHCQHVPDKPEEGLLCHRAVEQPNSVWYSKMPSSADAISPQVLMFKSKDLQSHHSEKRDKPKCSSSSTCQPHKT